VPAVLGPKARHFIVGDVPCFVELGGMRVAG
jgi:hypothetical protein